MNLTVFHDPQTVLDQARTYLEAKEPNNSLILGRLEQMRQAALHGSTSPPPLLIIARDGQSEIQLVADCNPINLVLSHGHPDAITPLIQEIASREYLPPGVVGPVDLVTEFCSQWSQATGIEVQHIMRQAIMSLTQIKEPRSVSGELKLMREEDVEVVADFLGKFDREALGSEEPEHPKYLDYAKHRVSQKMTYLWWEESTPKSMAALARPTQNGITVNAVYTPPRYRGHGYASNTVAEISRLGLTRGKRFCVLYTDLSNPISNAIYQRLGYERVGDSMHCRF
jgi:RimJ/RimL family protein N-acetyltransferase